MKKPAILVVVGVLLLAIPMSVFAAPKKVNWVGLVHKNDFAVFAGVGFGYGFTIAPGVEWAFADWKAGDVVPLAFGLTGKGMINFYSGFWTSYGIGALATAHLGLKGLDIPDFLQNLDFYLSLGVGLSWFSYNAGVSTYGAMNVGFATSDGLAYYINKNWAVYAEYTYWGFASGGTIGARYTF
jgi:hypothetical protein